VSLALSDSTAAVMLGENNCNSQSLIAINIIKDVAITE
jgi:hypothetical protein